MIMHHEFALKERRLVGRENFCSVASEAFLVCPVQLSFPGARPSYLIEELKLALFNNVATTCRRNDRI